MRRSIFVSTYAIAFVLASQVALAEGNPAARAQAQIDKALAYLKSQQKPDMTWQGPSDPPAITAIVLKAFMGDPKYDAENEFLEKGFDALLKNQKPDGSISNDTLATYNTAIAISALAASKEAEYKAQLDKALAYLTGLQWSDQIEGVKDQSRKVDDKDANFGGWGYGKKGRADGSNVQIALEALHDSGLKPEDPAYQRALKFITRQQNLSETNDQAWAGNDGGFVYTPSGGEPGKPGESFAGEYVGPNGQRMLRSYGSMTYAGLKSMIYAGLTKDDPRVKAAWEWIRKNWTLDENPGMKLNKPEMAQNGLFYYYMTLAKALAAYGEPVITDSDGKKHDWRVELIDELTSLQKSDGSWVNEKDKWMENNAVLVTAYTVQALQSAMQDLKDHPAK